MRTYNRLHQAQKINVNKIKDLCRLCMSSDISMYDIFTVSEDSQTSSLSSKILKCLSIEVKDNSGFPTKLCACCLKSLNACTEFWEQCHRTNRKLHQVVENSDPLTAFEAIIQSSPSYSGYDELYKSPEHSHLFSADDEDPTISESPVHFTPLLLDSSEKTFLVEGNQIDPIESNSTCDHTEFPEETSNYVPSGISLFESDICAETSPNLELEDVNKLNESRSNVEVQVSLNGKSYIVKVLDQSREKVSITDSETEGDDTGHSSQNSEVIPECHNNISYQCPICSDSFNNSSDLETHAKVHKDAKGFMCKFCFKWFSIKSGLVRHERIHSGERPYKCDNCSKSFTQKEVLRRHLLTHSGNKPFKCDSCDKSYTQKEALRMHIKNNHVPRKSLEIMQYKCNLCEKSFCHPSGLSRHQQSHAGRKYPCKNCDKVFTDQSCLKRHNQRVHLSENSQASGRLISNNPVKQVGAAGKMDRNPLLAGNSI